MQNNILQISSEVNEAIADGKAVVALESTIISHGMPFPKNVETALLLENIIRKEGAIPATIGLMDGQLMAGLSENEIERLGKLGSDTMKVSRRDIAIALQQKKTGATTVAATMIIAEMAGIRFFATGGIGGVHRAAAETMDISADLQELVRSKVAVVCAGAKSILDLGLTMEYLETLGVPVIGYRTDELPAFFSRKSGVPIPCRMDELDEIAATLHLQWELGLGGGMLIANPISAADEILFSEMEPVIETAIAEADEQQISGKSLTPFLLARIELLTAGKSLAANIKLVSSNARVAARLAKAYWLFMDR